MLTPADNELLTQTGPGTPMGAMLREYWWPVLRADKLERDGAPERVRLMGENYVAFRDTEGRLGFLDEHCPHRRVSLVLARNEDCGLRCLMHGWKIDVNGKVVETPNEVEAGARLDRLKVRHFPIREGGGMVWVYVGEKEAPPFPNFPFNDAVTIEPMICTINANWIQVFETLWDPAHVAILHGQDNNFKKTWEGAEDRPGAGQQMKLAVSGCVSQDQPYGFRYRFGDGLVASEPDAHWVPTVMPCWIFITAGGGDQNADGLVFAHTPIDDEHMLLWEIPYNLTGEFGPFGRVLANAVGEEKHDFRLPTMIFEQNWGQDRQAMKNESFSGLGVGKGVLGILNQDVAAAESMGAVTNRALENLGPADHALIKGRQMFLDAIRAYQATGRALGSHVDVSGLGKLGGEDKPATMAAE
jgi:phenylpropionate dioxygenase-like ring-hydroxylating dioxygenase large terminal subunit